MSDIEQNDAELKREEAVEKVRDLLVEREAMVLDQQQVELLRKASDTAWRIEMAATPAVVSLNRLRVMQAFWSACLGVAEDKIDETMLMARWEEVFSLCPSREAYARGLRAVLARVAAERPQMLGAYLVDICGPGLLLTLIEQSAGRAWDEQETAGAKGANVHEAPSGTH